MKTTSHFSMSSGEGTMMISNTLVFERFGSKIRDLILEMEETFDNPDAPTVDVVLNRRVWEVSVIDWTRQDEDEN
jgi:hypothetical protein